MAVLFKNTHSLALQLGSARPWLLPGQPSSAAAQLSLSWPGLEAGRGRWQFEIRWLLWEASVPHLTGSPQCCLGVLTTWRLAFPQPGSGDGNRRGDRGAVVSEGIHRHFCLLPFVRSESLSPAHSQWKRNCGHSLKPLSSTGRGWHKRFAQIG